MTAEANNRERDRGRQRGRGDSTNSTEGAETAGNRARAFARLATRREAIAAFGICLVFLAAGAGPWREVAHDFFGRTHPFWVREDFTAFYAAGHVVGSGMASHLYDTETIRAAEHLAAGRQVGGSGLLMYFNPPFFALVYWPLTHLSLQQAYQLWTVFSIGLLALNSWLLLRLTPGLSRRWQVVLVLGYLTLYPVTFGLRLGQFSLLLQASWAAGALLLEQRRDRWAGLAFAPLLIKPELLIPVGIFILAKRRWQTLATLVPIALAAVAGSVAMVGVPTALQYPAFVLGSTASNGNGVAPNLMIDYSGAIAATLGHGASITRPLASTALAVASLAAVALLANERRGAGRSGSGLAASGAPAPGGVDRDFRIEWLAVSLAAVLSDPHLYLQDTVIVVPAALALLPALHGAARNQFALVLAFGWGIQRLALYPNDHLHVDLFALLLTAMLFVLLAKAWHAPRWKRAERPERLGRRAEQPRLERSGERALEPVGIVELGDGAGGSGA